MTCEASNIVCNNLALLLGMKQTQIFPINVKGIAGSLVVLVNWSGAWAVSYTFNFLMSWSSPGIHSQMLVCEISVFEPQETTF